MSGLEEDLKVKAVEVEEKKAQAEAMIPRLEAEKSTADGESRAANKVADEKASLRVLRRRISKCALH